VLGRAASALSAGETASTNGVSLLVGHSLATFWEPRSVALLVQRIAE